MAVAMKWEPIKDNQINADQNNKIKKPATIQNLNTIAQIKGIVSFAEANGISIGAKAVRLHWPVLPECWRSVKLAEIPIAI